MRILYITHMYPSKELPQYCIFLHQQVKALIKKGVDVTVLVPTTNEERNEELFDGVQVLYLRYKDFSRTILYPIVRFTLTKETNRYVKVAEFDLIYAIHGPANILDFARSLSEKYKKPLIVHYRGYNIFDEYESQKKVLFSNVKKVQENVVKKSALSIGVSKKTSQIITERFPLAPVVTIYNGVDSTLFSEDENRENGEEIRLLCVANLIPIKGHKFLFEALKMIQDEIAEKKIVLDVVGRGFYEEELKKYVQEKAVKNVNFHGYVHYDKVAEYMKKTDIFVLPSIYESFGNVCMEAMACKKPIVIFEGQGIDELVQDGVSAMVAPKGNTYELYLRIKKLIINEELRRNIAQEGLKIARRYSWDFSAQKIIENIENLVENEN